MSVSLYTSQTPALDNVSELVPRTVAITVTFSVSGTVSGIRVYAPSTVGAGTHGAALWRVVTDDSGGAGTGAGTLLTSASFGALTPSTWNTVSFAPVAVTAGDVYVVGWRTSEGRYTATGSFFSAPLVNGPITGIQGGSAAGGFATVFNGRFGDGIVNYPTQTFSQNAYFVDVLFDPEDVDIELAATLSASASMTAAFTVEAAMAATLSASASMTAAFTITSTSPSDPIAAPVAEELLACFAEKLQTLPSPPKYIQLRVGQETGPLIGPGVDECCSGLAWVRVAEVYPSWDNFPSADNTWLPCGPLAYAVVLEMGMAFCMPWSDSDGSFEDIDPPSTQDWAAAFATQMRDQTLMRQPAACCFRPTQRRAVGAWSPLPVEGGCTGGKLTVTVSVPAPCSDC